MAKVSRVSSSKCSDFLFFFGGTGTGTSKIWNRKKVPEPVREVVKKKKRSFYVQADRKGGEGGSAPSALTVSKCENNGPISPFI